MMNVNVEKIPEMMKALNNWVVWKHDVAKGKVPYCASDPKCNASATDKTTWSTFDMAVRVMTAYNFDGVGFALTDTNLIAVDIDNCTSDDNQLTSFAKYSVEMFDSYTEVSPSGKGLRIIVSSDTGEEYKNLKKPEIEIWSKGRYVTMTGQLLSDDERTVISERSAKVVMMISDWCIIDRIRASDGKSKFERLWFGGVEGDDESKLDQEMCCQLSYFTQDTNQIDRIVRMSGLYRTKWERQDYREATIQKALELRSDKETTATTSEIKILSYEDIKKKATENPPIAIINKVLYRGDLSFLYSKSGSGKTTLVTYAAGCVMQGIPFFGFDTSPCPVVYVNADNVRWNHVVDILGQAADTFETFQRNLHCIDCDEMKLPLPSSYFVSLIDQIPGPGWLIIDHLRCAIMLDEASGAENDSAIMTRKLRPLRELARKSGWAITILHHSRRDDGSSYSGSGAIASQMDLDWNLVRNERNNTSITKMTNRLSGEYRIDFTWSREEGFKQATTIHGSDKMKQMMMLFPDSESKAKTIEEVWKANESVFEEFDWQYRTLQNKVSEASKAKKGMPQLIVVDKSKPHRYYRLDLAMYL